MRQEMPAAPLRVDLLGPVRVHRGPHTLELGSAKQRAVFAWFALHADTSVSVDSIVEAVWSDSRPASARHLVHTYVARLRQLLEPDMPARARTHVIGSAPLGYQLLLEGGQVDVVQYRRLVGRAGQSLDAGDWRRCFELLGEALRLWQDPSLSEVTALLRDRDELDILRQSWTEASLDYVSIGLEHGLAPVVLPTAERLAIAEPLHEGVQSRYLVTLAETGQRATAVARYADLRARLLAELGVEPGPELAEAYRQVLSPPTIQVRRPAISPVADRPQWRGPGPGVSELVARDDDLDAVRKLLSEQRLVTLAGPAGCGKSALALNTAERIRDMFSAGVAVVDVSDRRTQAELTQRVLSVLGAPAGGEELTRLLEQRQMLLVFDNVEHLTDGCAAVVEQIMRTCRYVSVLVTSREPLGLPYEAVWRVEPLSVPDPACRESQADSPAVRLFLQRAAQVRPGFDIESNAADTVTLICRRLDGLPLALEIAAACLATDTLEGVLSKIDDPLRQLRPRRRGWPTYHRSLHTALQRSVDCLTPLECWCFIRLSAAPKRFAAARAQQLCGPPPVPGVNLTELLDRLVDKSLLQMCQRSGGVEYFLLNTVRRMATELHAADALATGTSVDGSDASPAV